MLLTTQKPPINFNEIWKTLKETVKDILTQGSVSREAWQKSFSDIYSITSNEKSLRHLLFNSTKILLEEHVLQLLHTVQTGSTANLLQNYYAHCQKYNHSVKYLDLLYHQNVINDDHHTIPEVQYLYGPISTTYPKHFKRIRDLGLNIWYHNMILPLKDSMPKLLLDEIDKLRCNISITTSEDIIIGVINSFIEVNGSNYYPLEFYQSYFEKPFLEQSRLYFKQKASNFKLKFNLSIYLVKVLQLLKDEQFRSRKFLHDSTNLKVTLMCHQHLVINFFHLIHGEFETILKEERLNDMHNTFLLLFENQHELCLLAKLFREHIEKEGMKIIEYFKQKQIQLQFIEKVLDLLKKYKSIVEGVFNNDFEFSKALDKALTVIINYKLIDNQPSKFPGYLSNYCDVLLKKSHKKICKAEIDLKLLQSITIFEFIDDKAIFHDIYQKQLAKRLILQQSQSMDQEKTMIDKLKHASGYELTTKIHQMFTDISVSNKLNAQFVSEHIATYDLNISFSTCVLNTGAWPLRLTTTSSFVLPGQLLLCIQNFEMFYKGKFNERKLTWLHHLSRGELKLNYLQKNYTVTLQTIQMSILLLFENRDTLKHSEISDILQLTNEEFQKHINSLVNCKLLLLDGDNVKLNMAFTNKRTKFHVPLAIKKDGQEIESIKDNRTI